MKKLFAAAAFALAAPSLASAQAPYVGLRVGYGMPFGDISSGAAQRDVITSGVPLQLDAGFKLGPIDGGAYFSYGFAQPESSCTGSCSANVIRAGLQGSLHSEIRPGREVWAGVLAGYERLSAGGGSASGWEGGLQAGFDFASSTTGFGPFVSLTIGQFSSITEDGTSASVPDKKFHGTFQLGVRGFFKI
ncbi:MAG TPA: hypothetical protein VF894_09510 [Anaeromyxobacter sp.]